MNPELLGCHFGSGDAIRDLLERDISGIVRSTMVGLHIDAEWREATIVGGAKALFVNVFGRSNQLIANLCADSGRGLCVTMTPIYAICGSPFASSLKDLPTNL